MNVERARVAEITVTPDVVEQILTGCDSSRAFYQIREQSKLFAGKFNVRAGAGNTHVGKSIARLPYS